MKYFSEKFKRMKEKGFIQHFFSSLKKKNAGFTLIETLVAISILLVAIVGPMEIASKGLFSAFYARDEITSYYLAQEGLEFVRNARDTVFLMNNSNGTALEWLSGLGECEAADITDDGCTINIKQGFSTDETSDVIKECSGDCPVLSFDDTTGIYAYNGPDDSKFTRTIRVFREGDGNEAVVESEITWTVGQLFTSARTFTIKERIFNWIK